MNDTIQAQIRRIQESGETNMFNVPMVLHIANREGMYDLVVWLLENKPAYCRFILTGETEE